MFFFDIIYTVYRKAQNIPNIYWIW